MCLEVQGEQRLGGEQEGPDEGVQLPPVFPALVVADGQLSRSHSRQACPVSCCQALWLGLFVPCSSVLVGAVFALV